jgi:hypothetical protein
MRQGMATLSTRRWWLPMLAGWLLLAACAGPAPTAAPPTAPPVAPSPTVGPVPTTALAAAEFTWSVEIVQNSQTLTATNNTVQLAKSDFTIRVKLPQPLPVKLNVLNTDANFQALQPGYRLTDDCTLALCTGMDVAEDRLNPEKDLFVDPQLTHYLYYQGPTDHRWSRADVTATGASMERDVATLNTKPIAQYADPALYLLFFVNYTNPGQIDPGELQKIMLAFK